MAVHDDLMVVHDDESRAVYFDNEGHVIHYEIHVDGEGREVTFRSVDPAPLPGFRLTYRETAPGEVAIRFEISPSGRDEGFQTYLEGTALRAASGPP